MSTINAVILDLDDTLCHNDCFGIRLCDDTIKVLDFLKTKKVKIILASHNYSATEILTKLNILSYFDFVLAYYDYTDKASHLYRIMKHFNLTPQNILFFDDLSENILSLHLLGVSCTLVSNKTGITLKEVTSKFSIREDDLTVK